MRWWSCVGCFFYNIVCGGSAPAGGYSNVTALALRLERSGTKAREIPRLSTGVLYRYEHLAVVF